MPVTMVNLNVLQMNYRRMTCSKMQNFLVRMKLYQSQFALSRDLVAEIR